MPSGVSFGSTNSWEVKVRVVAHFGGEGRQQAFPDTMEKTPGLLRSMAPHLRPGVQPDGRTGLREVVFSKVRPGDRYLGGIRMIEDMNVRKLSASTKMDH